MDSCRANSRAGPLLWSWRKLPKACDHGESYLPSHPLDKAGPWMSPLPWLIQAFPCLLSFVANHTTDHAGVVLDSQSLLHTCLRPFLTILVLLQPGESHGWRSLVGYSLWGHREWDTTERLCLKTFGLPHSRSLLLPGRER